MATINTHVRSQWPFMSNERKTIAPAAWQALTVAMLQRRASPKHEMTQALLREYLEENAERKRAGQAAIQQAVNTLLSRYSH